MVSSKEYSNASAILASLDMLGHPRFPASVRLSASMIRLLVAVPAGDAERAQLIVDGMQTDLQTLVEAASAGWVETAIYASAAQETASYLMTECGIVLDLSPADWKEGRHSLREAEQRAAFVGELAARLYRDLLSQAQV